MKNAMREEALRRLDILESKGLMEEVKDLFEKENKILISERTIFGKKPIGTLFTVDEINSLAEYKQCEIPRKIKEFEKSRNALVYHATLEKMTFGLCLDLFYVSKFDEEWEMDREDLEGNCALVHVVNLTDDFLSETGSIMYEASGGGLIRTA